MSMILLTAGCGLNTFTQTVADEFEIPGKSMGPPPASPTYASGFNHVDLSQEKSFQNAGVSPSQVDAIYVKQVHLETDPPIEKLDVILKSVTIWVESPGVSRASIATATMFPPDSSASDLTVDTRLNLKPYATAPSMKFGADVSVNMQPAFTTKLKTTVTLEVDIHLPGT